MTGPGSPPARTRASALRASAHRHRRQRGALLIEALVAMLIVAFGVLGFVGLQARTAVGNLEGYQRAQALVLLNDIAQRMAINRVGARNGYYLRTGIGASAACAVPAAPVPAPPGFDLAAFNTANADLCAWAELIRGSAEKDAGNRTLGAMAGGRGCIEADPAQPGEFVVSVAWQGLQATGAPRLACGAGQYPSEGLRRGASTVVRVGSLS